MSGWGRAGKTGLAALLALGCGDATRPAPPAPDAARRATSIVLISLDAASARYFEPYGAPAGATPHVARLARESVVFDAAYSQTATTVSSVASLLTGVRATTHLAEPKTMQPIEQPVLPELLREHGYRAVAVVANPMAGLPRLGFHRGYEVYRQLYTSRALPDNPAFGATHHKLVHPEDVNAAVAELVADLAPTKSFAYLHYLQPHTPYDPPARFREAEPDAAADVGWGELRERLEQANRVGRADRETIELLESRYRANLRYADAGLGALLDALRAAGLYETSLIVLTADHGEAFWGHGQFGHNWTLYDDMVRVPLLMRFPVADGVAPRRIAHPTEAIDLLPTFFDYLGLPVPEACEGDSLWPLIRGAADALPGDEVVLSTAWRDLHAIREGPWKLVADAGGRGELYDLRSDPDEHYDLAAAEPEIAARLRARLGALVDLRSGESIETAEPAALEPDLVDLLEQLGYGRASHQEGD